VLGRLGYDVQPDPRLSYEQAAALWQAKLADRSTDPSDSQANVA
jgi:hypothetical protein